MKDSTFKRIAIFTIVLLFSLLGNLPATAKSNQSYIELWKRIDSLLQIQQPESALKVLEVVYKKSKSESLQIQQIKAFVGIEQIKLETSDEVVPYLSLIHISEPTRLGMISYAVFCLKKKKKKTDTA